MTTDKKGLRALLDTIGDNSQALDSLNYYPNLDELMDFLKEQFNIEWWPAMDCYMDKDEPHYKAAMMADAIGDIQYDEFKDSDKG